MKVREYVWMITFAVAVASPATLAFATNGALAGAEVKIAEQLEQPLTDGALVDERAVEQPWMCVLSDEEVQRVQLSLSYPGDCKASKMKKACSKNGCRVKSGGKHNICEKSGRTITLIPHTVKSNNTCRDAIKKINANC